MVEAIRTWRLLAGLRSSIGKSPDALLALQDERLRAAVTHAHRNVPFYRRVWQNAGFDPRGFRGLADLSSIPIITSGTVDEGIQRGELLDAGVREERCQSFTTSGSTGTPRRVWRAAREMRVWKVVPLRIWFEHGFRMRHVTAKFEARPEPLHFAQHLGLLRRTSIPTGSPIGTQLEQFARIEADVVVGTPTDLRRLAHAIRAGDETFRRPRLVFCHGELLDGSTRRLIHEILGVDPVSVYGLTEVGLVAWQCERRSFFHENSETCLVQVHAGGAPARPGVIGSIVVTDLMNWTMPLLRYDTGDLAIAADGPCPCGRPLPVIGSIEGRRSESVHLSDGRIVSTRAILEHLDGTLRVGEFELHQLETARFRLDLHPPLGTDDRTSAGPDGAAIRQRLHELLGDVEIAFSFATSRPDPSGSKTRSVVSHVV